MGHLHIQWENQVAILAFLVPKPLKLALLICTVVGMQNFTTTYQVAFWQFYFFFFLLLTISFLSKCMFFYNFTLYETVFKLIMYVCKKHSCYDILMILISSWPVNANEFALGVFWPFWFAKIWLVASQETWQPWWKLSWYIS